MPEAILYESHSHTPLCGHAVGEPEEYAAVAVERGLAGITITCHGPTSHNWWHCMREDQWPEYLQIVDRARRTFSGRVDVRTGVECDYFPGLEEDLKRFLGENELSHVLGSVHPQVGAYRERFWNGDDRAYQRLYFEHLAMAAETRLFDTLAHPDLVKNFTADHWDIQEILPDIKVALDRIALAGTAMELNTSGLNKTIAEMNPAPEILVEMGARGIPVVLGADAHVPERVSADFEDALDLLADCGYKEVTFFVERKPRTVAIDVARASLKKTAPASS